ncbi:MAG: hypothetical protein E6K95_07660 [Thaumarchaeota archaeon]|nr:MAG: hypothetical protein E6K95_07660 [Nitrososphaerota archaeon]
MPYTLPDALRGAERLALVVAFGRLSVLEACSTVKSVTKVEVPCERICVVELDPSSVRSVVKLAGIHKFSPLLTHFQGDEAVIRQLVQQITNKIDVWRLALSAYDTDEADYEVLVRLLLDAFREAGFKKIRLLRPKGNELFADQVLSRDALDLITFPYKGGYGLGPTAWVPDVAPMRERGVEKPVPHSGISLSPRLAQLLLNLSGLSPGQRLLDPFCGSGTIISEGALMSLNCVGIDSNPARVAQAKRNLAWVEKQSGRTLAYHVETGDARDFQGRFDGIVTEPILLPRFHSTPSSQKAKQLVNKPSRVYSESLYSMAEAVRKGGRIVIVVPTLKTADGSEVLLRLEETESIGLKEFQPGHVRFEYPVRVAFESTRWLGRAVYVFERV